MIMSSDKHKRVYYFPPRMSGGYDNPYSDNYRAALSERYRIANVERVSPIMSAGAFLVGSLRADIYVVNWLEGVAFLRWGKVKFALAMLALLIIRLRRAKVVWMFHNMHPHGRHNAESRRLSDYLFRHASLIISHSREATAYARRRARAEVVYVCHPVHDIERGVWSGHVPQCDVLIWGSVIAYKGIREFLAERARRGSTLRVRIIGSCHDGELDAAIRALCDDRVVYEPRRASFEEVEAAIGASRYVLLPYVGSCVSSSGALIDTIVLGGTPVGPARGAFSDLAAEGVCLTYDTYDELFALLGDEHTVSDERRRAFAAGNTWRQLVDVLEEHLPKS